MTDAIQKAAAELAAILPTLKGFGPNDIPSPSTSRRFNADVGDLVTRVAALLNHMHDEARALGLDPVAGDDFEVFSPDPDQHVLGVIEVDPSDWRQMCRDAAGDARNDPREGR